MKRVQGGSALAKIKRVFAGDLALFQHAYSRLDTLTTWLKLDSFDEKFLLCFQICLVSSV